MELLPAKPEFIPQPRYRGVKAIGIGYERKIARYLKALLGGRAVHNPWYRFVDADGEGWCCPDIVVLPKDSEPLVIVECKLTATKTCEPKAKGLYLPVVQHLYPEQPIRLIQVCKNLGRGFEGYLINNWKSAVDPSATWDFATWNFQKPPR